MSRVIKLLFFGFFVITLSACVEVEDNGNDEELAALEEQNQILREQLDVITADAEPDPAPVTLYGFVEDGLTNAPINGGTATLTIGLTARNPVNIENGFFEIPEVPSNSDFELFFEGPDGYIGRAFYGQTVNTPNGIAVQDAGRISLFPSQMLTFSVVNRDTLEAIGNLQFSAESHLGEGSAAAARRHFSTPTIVKLKPTRWNYRRA